MNHSVSQNDQNTKYVSDKTFSAFKNNNDWDYQEYFNDKDSYSIVSTGYSDTSGGAFHIDINNKVG